MGRRVPPGRPDRPDRGHAFKFHYQDYEAFCAGFGFEETPDQAAAIEAVLVDLKCGKPMDRLICGYVGFGKTEVALRAAFVAVADGKQVAVLAPTTLLAGQHFQNFSIRFADWPVKIAELSRFRSGKEQAQALGEMAEGKLDIIIGTHKLIQKVVKFHNLGLVILDEASSRLDPATEQKLERAIDKLLEGRTAIIIAHRLDTVHRADEIMILDKGQMSEYVIVPPRPHTGGRCLLMARHAHEHSTTLAVD